MYMQCFGYILVYVNKRFAALFFRMPVEITTHPYTIDMTALRRTTYACCGTILVTHIRPLTNVRLVLVGLNPVALTAQPLEVGPYIEARILDTHSARIFRLCYGYSSGHYVVHNGCQPLTAHCTHWLLTDNTLAYP
jgi:hypothetical protein